MKKCYHIPQKIIDDIIDNKLTRNQSLVIMAAFSQDEDIIYYVRDKFYHNHVNRYLKDLDLVGELYKEEIEQFKYTEAFAKNLKKQPNTSKLKRNNNISNLFKENKYYKIKPFTFEQIIGKQEIEPLSLTELIIFLFFIRLYRKTWSREYSFNLYDLIKTIFKTARNIRRYRKYLINTLEKLHNLKHTDGSLFILDYELTKTRNPKIKIKLTPKTNIKKL